MAGACATNQRRNARPVASAAAVHAPKRGRSLSIPEHHTSCVAPTRPSLTRGGSLLTIGLSAPLVLALSRNGWVRPPGEFRDRIAMTKQVFFDPQRKRWKRLRRIFDITALAGLIVGTVFVVGLLRMKPLPELVLGAPKRNYSALPVKPGTVRPGTKPRAGHRRTNLRASDVPLNSGEGLRAAYYVEDDPASYSSLRQHIHQIDILFPEWIHVVSPEGNLTSYTIDNRPFQVVDNGGVHGVDHENKVAHAIAQNQDESPTEIFPLVNNYDPTKGAFLPSIGDFLSNPDARANFVRQVDRFLGANPSYRGLSLDLEEIPSEAQQGYMALVAALYQDFHSRNLRLYVNAPVGDDDWDMAYIAQHSDGILLMNYDQHQTESGPGPIASQDWFVDNLKKVLKTVPKEKLICSLGSYGYDWTMPLTAGGDARHKNAKPTTPANAKPVNVIELSTQEAWQAASDAEAQIALDPNSL